MDTSDLMHAEFDSARRIVLLSYPNLIEITDRQNLDQVFAEAAVILTRYAAGGRLYLIVDLHNISIDPSLAEEYSAHVTALSEQYLYPGGIARYGFQLTRVTVLRGYAEVLKLNPNLFNTRQEAEAYISSLIVESETSKYQVTTSTVPDSADC